MGGGGGGGPRFGGGPREPREAKLLGRTALRVTPRPAPRPRPRPPDEGWPLRGGGDLGRRASNSERSDRRQRGEIILEMIGRTIEIGEEREDLVRDPVAAASDVGVPHLVLKRMPLRRFGVPGLKLLLFILDRSPGRLFSLYRSHGRELAPRIFRIRVRRRERLEVGADCEPAAAEGVRRAEEV